jgi:hypothetical protein
LPLCVLQHLDFFSACGCAFVGQVENLRAGWQPALSGRAYLHDFFSPRQQYHAIFGCGLPLCVGQPILAAAAFQAAVSRCLFVQLFRGYAASRCTILFFALRFGCAPRELNAFSRRHIPK